MSSNSFDDVNAMEDGLPEYGSVGAALLLLCLVSAALFYLLWTEIAAPADAHGTSMHDSDMGITAELLRARMEQCMQRVELVSLPSKSAWASATCRVRRLSEFAKGLT